MTTASPPLLPFSDSAYNFNTVNYSGCKLDMNSQNPNELVRIAEQIYQDELREELEAIHPNFFVAIEPKSGRYFLGKTLSEAVGFACDTFPDRLSHVTRIGHKAALHFSISLK